MNEEDWFKFQRDHGLYDCGSVLDITGHHAERPERTWERIANGVAVVVFMCLVVLALSALTGGF